MANVELYPIKYTISHLTFKKPISVIQYYNLYYTKAIVENGLIIRDKSRYSDILSWTQIVTDKGLTKIGYNFDGTIIPNSQWNLNSSLLDDFTTYVVKFVEINNKYTFYTFFKTGSNIALADSPYYNKVLFPGQTYDLRMGAVSVVDDASGTGALFYYPLSAKKGETSSLLNPDEANWFNILTLPDLTGTAEFECRLDFDNTAVVWKGFLIDNGTFLALPNCQLLEDDNGETVRNFDYENSWAEAGGGKITAAEALLRTIGFAFYIKDDVTSLNTDGSITLQYVSTSTSAEQVTEFGRNYLKRRIYVDTNGYICYYDTTNYSNITTSLHVNKNKWYYMILSGESIALYWNNIYDEVTPLSSVILYTSLSTQNMTNINGVTPRTDFCFGDRRTKGLLVSKITGNINISANAVSRILNPWYKIEGVIQYNGNPSYPFVIGPGYINPDNDVVHITIPPDLLESSWSVNISDKNSCILYLTTEGKKMDTNYGEASITFEGFKYPTDNLTATQESGSIINPALYEEDLSFVIDFLNLDTYDKKLKALQRYFFTKHGTWGGYNGGVSGNLTYFNEDGNLILEAHGDTYNGDVPGVWKESNVQTHEYTGFGPDLDYSSLCPFDHRNNKDKVRTGTALVSNKYFSYGEVSVTMKIPRLPITKTDFGVCPALWFFHYVELYPEDKRYKTPPYSSRNAQGDSDNGFYRVVNNEIDIELPSHLTNGRADSFSTIRTKAYFDENALDNKMHIGIDDKLYRLINPKAPYAAASWKDETYKTLTGRPDYRYEPTFKNIKVNTWVGELNSGDGWCISPDSTVSSEDYYKGTGAYYQNEKEEYLSQLTNVATNWNGYADGLFHKWSIVWHPDVVYVKVDDKIVREDRVFIPFCHMKYTAALWFPTMPLVNKNGSTFNFKTWSKATNKDAYAPVGVRDIDGIYSSDVLNDKKILTSITNDTPIGTWAGLEAYWDVFKLEISKIEYIKYDGPEKPTYPLGESFPESGLRQFVAPDITKTLYNVSFTICTNGDQDSTIGGVTSGQGVYAYGANITIIATAADGYIFEGWYYSDGTLYSEEYITTIKSINRDINLIAKFKSYTPPTTGGDDDTPTDEQFGQSPVDLSIYAITKDTQRVIDNIQTLAKSEHKLSVWTVTSDIHSLINNTSIESKGTFGKLNIYTAVKTSSSILNSLPSSVYTIGHFNTGDIIDRIKSPNDDGTSVDNPSNCYIEDLYNNITLYKSWHTENCLKPIFMIPGNHDAKVGGSTGTQTLTKAEAANYYKTLNTDATWWSDTEGGNGYYKNDSALIIFVFIDFYKWEGSDSKQSITEFLTKLSEVVTLNPGYKYVVLGHEPAYVQYTNSYTSSVWTDSHNSIPSKTADSIYETLGYDNIIVSIHGHRHADVLCIANGFPIVLNGVTGLLGINDETQRRLNYYNAGEGGGYTYTSDEADTLAMCTVNVYCYDHTSNKLYTYRVGPGIDVEMSNSGTSGNVTVDNLVRVQFDPTAHNVTIPTGCQVRFIASPLFNETTQLEDIDIISYAHKGTFHLDTLGVNENNIYFTPCVPKGWRCFVAILTYNSNQGKVESVEKVINLGVIE